MLFQIGFPKEDNAEFTKSTMLLWVGMSIAAVYPLLMTLVEFCMICAISADDEFALHNEILVSTLLRFTLVPNIFNLRNDFTAFITDCVKRSTIVNSKSFPWINVGI